MLVDLFGSIMGDDTSPTAETAADPPSYSAPRGYNTLEGLEGAYVRSDGECAACGVSADRDETVMRHLWPGDFSDRSEVSICDDCAASDDWADDVRARRIGNAGAVRGSIISHLWPYSTAQVLAAGITIAAAVVLAVGWGAAVMSGVASEYLWLAPGSVAAVVTAGTWALIYVDPRGALDGEQMKWEELGGVCLIGLGSAWAAATAVPSGSLGMWALLGVELVCGIAATHQLDAQVRADRSYRVLSVPRAPLVAPLRGVAYGVAVGSVIPTGVSGVPIILIGVAPMVVAVGYLIVRAPNDNRLRSAYARVRDELDDLLNGGHF